LTGSALSLKQRLSISRFFEGEAPVPGPLLLNHRRVFILPTRQGLAFILLLVLVLLIAFVYNNNLAYMLAFLLASVFFITILHTFKSLAGLVVQAGQSTAVFAGEQAGFQFTLRNPGNQARPSVTLFLQEYTTVNPLPGETLSVILYRQAARRGWLECGTLTVSSSYPLGLFRAWSPLRFGAKALVYPQPAPPGFALPETEAMGEGGGRYRLRGDDFYGLRDYQTSDAIRQIHWKSLAKGLGLHSKQYSGEAGTDLWLDYDTAPGNGVEERLSCLCRWVLDAEQAGLRYGLRLPGSKIACEGGREHHLACLQALALFGYQ
jgi:uncharacterized protein (DUF58 family)